MILYLSFPQLRYNAMKKNPISGCKNTKLSGNIKVSESGIDLNFFFRQSSLLVEGWDDMSEDGVVTVYARSNEKGADCPYCGHRSEKVHSRYLRHLQDLPAFGESVTVCFQARKFFCHNQDCRYRTFAEQPGNEIFRYRRRTRRCEVCVHRHGLAMSSIRCSGMLKGMGVIVSKSTVLRDLHRMRLPDSSGVRRIGIDDWAFRKGTDYGSIIVDLSTGSPIDMLPSRCEQDFSEWLSVHRSVWLVSRDRATSYSAAAGSCGFPVTEVADRFHLMKNLGECVADTISARYREICGQLRGDIRDCKGDAREAGDNCVKPYAEERWKEVKRLQEEGMSVSQTSARLGMDPKTVRRYRSIEDGSVLKVHAPQKGYVYEGRFNEVKRLQEEGKGVSETMSLLGMARATVVKYRGLDSFPVPKSKSVSACHLHTAFVEEQYARGISLAEIHRRLVSKGAGISRMSFYWHFSYLSDGHRGYRPEIQKAKMEADWQSGIRQSAGCRNAPVPSARSVTHTVMKSVLGKELSEYDRKLMDMLRQHGWFEELHEAARSFRLILRSGCPSRVDAWLEKYGKSETSRFQTFMNGLRRDIVAVRNAVLFKESNGIVEGYVNKLKAVKRSMYGKAKLDLLKVKMVMPAWIFN